MADQTQAQERSVSMIITIIIDSLPQSQTLKLEEQARQVGDEWNARVNVTKGEAINTPAR